jgi:hypothetical protein
MPITALTAHPMYRAISKKPALNRGCGHMRTQHWLEYDLVALGVLVIGITILLVAFSG